MSAKSSSPLTEISAGRNSIEPKDALDNNTQSDLRERSIEAMSISGIESSDDESWKGLGSLEHEYSQVSKRGTVGSPISISSSSPPPDENKNSGKSIRDARVEKRRLSTSPLSPELAKKKNRDGSSAERDCEPAGFHTIRKAAEVMGDKVEKLVRDLDLCLTGTDGRLRRLNARLLVLLQDPILASDIPIAIRFRLKAISEGIEESLDDMFTAREELEDKHDEVEAYLLQMRNAFANTGDVSGAGAVHSGHGNKWGGASTGARVN